MSDVDLTEAPADLDAERSVLGALMTDRRLHEEISDILTGGDFWQPAHEVIWNAIARLAEAGRPLDPISVRADLETHQELQAAGGPLALADLYGAVTVPADAVAHARIVHDRAVQRRTITAAVKIRQLAAQGSEDVQAMIEAAQATLDLVDPGTRNTSVTVADSIGDMIDLIGSDQLAGLDTPWPDLNNRLGGLQGGRVYAIGARPGVGKSLMGQGLAEHFAANHRRRVLLATCEMSRREVNTRMLARATGITITRLEREGQFLTEVEWQTIARATDRMRDSHSRLHVVDEAQQSVASIRSEARTLARRGDLGLVVIDYLQLLTPPATTRRDRNREQEVAETSRRLKAMAMELDVPVVILSQLNRAMATRADKRPGLTDLRESGSIEQDSDAVILLHQPDADEQPWDLEVIVAKNRGGPLGSCHLIQQGWCGNLASASRLPDPNVA
jgi:replicative DNA helicase